MHPSHWPQVVQRKSEGVVCLSKLLLYQLETLSDITYTMLP